MNDNRGDRPRTLSAAEVAEELGLCRDWIYHLLRTGALPGAKLGSRTWRIRRETVDAILAGELRIGRAS
ncbi:hypothetical protein NIIDNTM18_29800 [Mycolicibacterium litorale]|uniref:Helix-turn-helix domain-containing protein n=1 Tax=Mycolicibacterium litorale TaxID=758802 RepID=A0A6S6P6D2_9MYCO|nr:helix-turn-helix domain-containing protein [Mycolicibacterium litorale]BCI53702.1 hypothetical protein NIIDNTM18_29800 [Mycolicibacterium litorale]